MKKIFENVLGLLGIAGIVLGLVVGLFLATGIVFGIPIYYTDRYSCLKSYSDYQPQYSFWTSCRISYNGKITPVDMVKNINLQ